MKKTLVIGASLNTKRYSHLAVLTLREHEIPTVALGLREGIVGDVKIATDKINYPDIHTVTLYLNENNQKGYEDFILSLNPKRIIFNPGAENPEFMKIADSKGIEVMDACTLVLLGTQQF